MSSGLGGLVLDLDIYQKVYQPIGFCIYCGKTNNELPQDGKLTKEHIIPLGLNGMQILPEASCKQCAKITGTAERMLLRDMFGPLRLRLKMKTRHKNEIPPKTTTYIVNKEGRTEKVELAHEDFPRVVPGLLFPPAGISISRPVGETVQFKPMFVNCPDSDIDQLKAKGHKEIGLFKLEYLTFLRCVAKIAHAYAYAICEYKFQPLLNDFILGISRPAPWHYVGGYYGDIPKSPYLHKLFAKQYNYIDGQYLFVALKLFGVESAPAYGFHVGKFIQPVSFFDKSFDAQDV